MNPQGQQLEGNVSLLNVNQVITSLACGQLDEQLKKDLLVVGTNTNIIAYDIDRNVDLFFKEVSLKYRSLIITVFFLFQESRWCTCDYHWKMG
jgi:hypothetical protein